MEKLVTSSIEINVLRKLSYFLNLKSAVLADLLSVKVDVSTNFTGGSEKNDPFIFLTLFFQENKKSEN
jgi:hypothetical protein